MGRIRKALLRKALAPLEGELGRRAFDKLAQSLSLIFGIEAMVVLRDIWGLDGEQTEAVAIWAADVLVSAAVAEAAGTQVFGASPRQFPAKLDAAERPSLTRKAVPRPRRKAV